MLWVLIRSTSLREALPVPDKSKFSLLVSHEVFQHQTAEIYRLSLHNLIYSLLGKWGNILLAQQNI